MLRIDKANGDELNIEIKEIFRYLGYGKNEPEKSVCDLVYECVKEVREKLDLKACYDKFEIIQNADKSISFGTINTKSKNLIKNLKNCDEVIVFVATIGIEVDRLIQKNSIINPAKSVILQAVGATVIEAWCDLLSERLKKTYKKFQRPRFSPGYGDFPLNEQTKIFEILDCNRKIGVGLTESLLMIPTKSVSAVIGLSDNNLNCVSSGCDVCKNLQCEFRRN